MADVQKGGRIVPIIAPHPHSLSHGSLVNEVKHEKQQPKELSQDSQSREPRNRRSKIDTECLELPCLNQLGLYALPTEGDGNCLYYALSDQLYGDFTYADRIRTQLADHISANREYFMSFIAAAGGERRAPRRAAAEAARNSYCSSSSASPAPPPSSKDKERNFDSKVAESRKNGVWGGAEEIQAFCQSFKKDVNVYTMYGIQNFRDVHAPLDEEREILHIAFHDFHHYSSVRHSHGPHTGPPCIPRFDKATQVNEASSDSPVVSMASPWKISVIQENLGGKYDRETIVGVLEECRGNIDNAFMNLLGENANTTPVEATASRAIMKSRFQPSSRSSSPFSTGSKRSADDSDEEENPRPASRRVRAREQKRRILPDVTVGIAFRDHQNDLVSLRLQVSPEKAVPNPSTEDGKEVTKTCSSEAQETSSVQPKKGRRLKPRSKQIAESSETVSSQQSESNTAERKLRRSQRVTRSRNGSQAL
ncbi:hypothetical protein BJY01DRAFT_232357 [Aspergillus pseudoustus]|uniref:OTU domain-containing protein n=1 Tax=Aspergillus pseudoustus TaxID=1810923 RepID=A0ABR4KLX7_9EURO